LSFIREKFHYIRDWPDDMLVGQSLADLAVVNSQARKMEDKSATSALEKKIAINYKELRAKPVKVDEGWDDSISTIHSCRLLPGVVCPLNKLWEKAQAELPEAGIRPLIQYDMQSTGLPAMSCSVCDENEMFVQSMYSSYSYCRVSCFPSFLQVIV
jgi:hypothetical protein